MRIYNLIILSGAAAAALIAWGNWRYVAWIGAMIASYVISVLYWDFSLPRAEFIAGTCDFLVCLAIFFFAAYRWELWLWRVMQVSLLVNIIYLASNLFGWSVLDHIVYSSALEIINVIAILIIGGTAAFEKAGMTDGLAFHPWMHVFGFVRPVYRRSAPDK